MSKVGSIQMMKKPVSNKQLTHIIEKLYMTYRSLDDGKLASYIPELSKADRKKFGIAITTTEGETLTAGDCDCPFTIQSISKPLVFGMALESHGLAHVRSRVGVEPTGDPFHSIIRLEGKSKRPANPMINTGAIAMTNLIKGKTPRQGQQRLASVFEKYTGRQLKLDSHVYRSEKSTGHRNRAMAHLMLNFGMVDPDVEETLDLYFRQCSYIVDSRDLSVMAATLAFAGVNPKTNKAAIEQKYVKCLLTLMLTCGLYTYAGEWAFNVGIPAKSGVSGGILAVVPGYLGIGVYSPLVDTHGNSVRGLKVFRDLAKELDFHVFS